jgi:hypothetical protein
LLSENAKATEQQKDNQVDVTNSQITVIDDNTSESLPPCWQNDEDSVETPLGNDCHSQPLLEQLSLTPEIIETTITALPPIEIERIPIVLSSHVNSQQHIVGGSSMNQCATSAEDETLLDNDDDDDLDLSDYLARWAPKQTSNYSIYKQKISNNSDFGVRSSDLVEGDIDDLLICEEEPSTVMKSGPSKAAAPPTTRQNPANRKRAASNPKARAAKRQQLSNELTSAAFTSSMFL